MRNNYYYITHEHVCIRKRAGGCIVNMYNVCVCSQLNTARVYIMNICAFGVAARSHRFRAVARKSRWLFVTHHLIIAC